MAPVPTSSAAGAASHPSLMADASGRLEAMLPTDHNAKTLVYWSLGLSSAVAAGAAVWWISRSTLESYYSYVPLQASGPRVWRHRHASPARAALTCAQPRP